MQFLVLVRTDVYLVLQDVAGARNLHADGVAYARWWLRRAARRPGRDPSLALPARERRAVRWYASLLVVGTAACLAAAVAVLGGSWAVWCWAWWRRHGRRLRSTLRRARRAVPVAGPAGHQSTGGR
ncbi:hypothetical protein [Micromonospora sp. WMMD712]|uniref:hypothetical protein n=1 Tax=Micromonospora sp. WMMD712 TaxID=3016096 RepID=UPI002499DD36|nr:hypothetical protein [Micromonospora sp. WMMD712]WFE56298.1 hypothetical protein O7633_05205 [Micromonospora sp. WMMD712]